MDVKDKDLTPYEVNGIRVSQKGFFSIPIVDAGGNGSKISSVLVIPFDFPHELHGGRNIPVSIMAPDRIRCAALVFQEARSIGLLRRK